MNKSQLLIRAQELIQSGELTKKELQSLFNKTNKTQTIIQNTLYFLGGGLILFGLLFTLDSSNLSYPLKLSL